MYCIIHEGCTCTVEFVILCTPPFPGENENLHTLIDCTVKMKLLFYCLYSRSISTMRWRKYDEMAFLASRNANKTYALLDLGVNRTPGTMAKFTPFIFS